MTTKVITGNYATGYYIGSNYNALVIASTATVGGKGVVGGYNRAVTNYGTINTTDPGQAGVSLGADSSVTNGKFFAPAASISGSQYGIYIGFYQGLPSGTVVNYGLVSGGKTGVVLSGTVVNSGHIAGGVYGVFTTGASTVTNSGTITGANKAGVDLTVGSDLTNNAVGFIQGYFGVEANGAKVTNLGVINGSHAGVVLNVGTLVNGSATYTTALIEGAYGVSTYNTSTVTNFGTIRGGDSSIFHGDYGVSIGGLLTNGSATDTTALIQGFNGVSLVGTLANYGVIDGTGTISGAVGVSLYPGGVLNNGAAGDRHALVEGYGGVRVTKGAATINNFGTIISTAAQGGYGVALCGGVINNGPLGDTTALIEGGVGVSITKTATIVNDGVILGRYNAGVASVGGGEVINGSASDRVATIGGYTVGVAGLSAAMTVINDATIRATGLFSNGVYLYGGGSVTNGGGRDNTALISGATGILLDHPGAVVNSATIVGRTGVGVVTYGGSVTNASTAAMIVGATFGIQARGAVTVKNSGTMLATGGAGAFGVALDAGGALSNGSSKTTSALIEGYNGAALFGNVTATNFGTIKGDGHSGGAGVEMGPGAQLINAKTSGGAGHLIEGFTGVATTAGAAATVTNFGTIVGEGGTAVQFNSAADVLNVEAGSVFTGAVSGDGATIVLVSGTGALGLLAVDSLVVSGSMAATTFSNFGTIDVGKAAKFTLAGADTVAAGQSLNVDGRLTDAGGLTVAGTIGGAGTLALTGGTDTLAAGAGLTVAQVVESGAATVVAVTASTMSVASAWTQTAGTVTVAAGDRVNFTGVGDGFAGTLAGAGTVAFTAGAATLNGATLAAASVILGAATVTVAGTLNAGGVVNVATGNLVVATGGASLTGGGTFTLSAGAAIHGASGAATLTNLDVITGAGALGGGSLTLINGAAGVIDANAASVLTLDTGAATIVNAGLIEATGAGGLTIAGAVNNNGALAAAGGNLTVGGAVTGAGAATVSNAILDFTSSFSGNVAFTSGFGMLELARSQSYGGAITGFSLTGGTSLDLRDIGFLSPGEASFSGTATSGVLTVSDGTHTARITLMGNYTASTFTVSNDGHGGVFVVDPPKAAAAPPPVGAASSSAFVSAMAGLGAAPASHVRTWEAWPTHQVALVAPRAMMA